MSSNYKIADNLTARSVLSPAFNFVDPTPVKNTTQGEINKNTLLNRVKKLNQEDRQELVNALNEVSEKINSTNPSNNIYIYSEKFVSIDEDIVPLHEKGVCALILADDGSQPKATGFFIGFLNILMNLFKLRISSGSIIDKITETRTLLLDYGCIELEANVSPESMLNREIGCLKNQIPDQAPQIQPYFDQLGRLRTELEKVENKDWNRLGTFFQFFRVLEKFNEAIAKEEATEHTRKTIDFATADIRQIIDLRVVNKTLPDLAKALKKIIIPYFKENRIAIKIWESWQGDLNALSRGESIKDGNGNRITSRENVFKYLKKELIIPFIDHKLNLIDTELKGIIESFNAGETKHQTDLKVLEGRLEAYRQNSVKNIRKNQLDACKLEAREVEEKLYNISSICELIEQVFNEKNQDLKEIVLTIRVALNRLLLSSGSVNNIRDHINLYIVDHFKILHDISKIDDFSDFSFKKLVKDNPVLNNAESILALQRMFLPFELDGVTDIEERKRTFINKWIDRLKSGFETMKLDEEFKLVSCRTRIARLEEALNPKPIVTTSPEQPQQPQIQQLSVQTPQTPRLQVQPQQSQVTTQTQTSPDPIIQVQPRPSVTSALPPHLQIPETGHHYLRTVADSIQILRENEGAAQNWYQIVHMDSASIDSETVKQVYHNFYMIMKDAGKLGPLQTSGPHAGESTDGNWGGNVFVNGKSNDVAPSIGLPLLNHYRVQAIVEVLQGRKRERANQTF